MSSSILGGGALPCRLPSPLCTVPLHTHSHVSPAQEASGIPPARLIAGLKSLKKPILDLLSDTPERGDRQAVGKSTQMSYKKAQQCYLERWEDGDPESALIQALHYLDSVSQNKRDLGNPPFADH